MWGIDTNKQEFTTIIAKNKINGSIWILCMNKFLFQEEEEGQIRSSRTSTTASKTETLRGTLSYFWKQGDELQLTWLTHVDAVMVWEAEMKDLPLFRLIRTSMVLRREKCCWISVEMKVRWPTHNATRMTCSLGHCTYWMDARRPNDCPDVPG